MSYSGVTIILSAGVAATIPFHVAGYYPPEKNGDKHPPHEHVEVSSSNYATRSGFTESGIETTFASTATAHGSTPPSSTSSTGINAHVQSGAVPLVYIRSEGANCPDWAAKWFPVTHVSTAALTRLDLSLPE